LLSLRPILEPQRRRGCMPHPVPSMQCRTATESASTLRCRWQTATSHRGGTLLPACIKEPLKVLNSVFRADDTVARHERSLSARASIGRERVGLELVLSGADSVPLYNFASRTTSSFPTNHVTV